MPGGGDAGPVRGGVVGVRARRIPARRRGVAAGSAVAGAAVEPRDGRGVRAPEPRAPGSGRHPRAIASARREVAGSSGTLLQLDQTLQRAGSAEMSAPGAKAGAGGSRVRRHRRCAASPDSSRAVPRARWGDARPCAPTMPRRRRGCDVRRRGKRQPRPPQRPVNSGRRLDENAANPSR